MKIEMKLQIKDFKTILKTHSGGRSYYNLNSSENLFALKHNTLL